MQSKKGESVLYIGILAMLSLFIIVIVFATFTPIHDTIRDTMNASFSGDEITTAGHINTAWGVSFLVLAASTIIILILASLTRQSKEYYP